MKSSRTSAVSTDPWDLYQVSVQDSTAQARVLEHLFRRIHRRHTPKVLREDFASDFRGLHPLRSEYAPMPA